MTEKPPQLDPESHEDDTLTSVWKRRLLLAFLIVLVVAVAAPSFSGCSGFFREDDLAASFVVAGRTHQVTEAELSGFIGRVVHTTYLLSHGQRGAFPEGEEGRKFAIRTLMEDAAAQAEGIEVPEQRIRDFIVRAFGSNEEYRRALSQSTRGLLNDDGFVKTMRTLMRVEEYEKMLGAAFTFVPGEEAYEAWKKDNVKLSVDYVASPLELQRAKVEAANPTDDELRSVADLPLVKQLLAVPPRKTIEVAYLKVADMTPAQLEAAKKYAEEADLFPQELPAAAFRYFHGKVDSVFTKEHWSRLSDPDFAAKHGRWKAEHEKWEKEAKETRGTEPPEPRDPATDYPTKEGAQYPLWRERVEKETLAEKIVEDLAKKAEREAKSFAEVGADYARFGVKVVKNKEPLSDLEIKEKFPDPVARDSEFEQVARVVFKAPADASSFKPLYRTQAVPTTQLSDAINDRGFMVMRLESSDPARQYSVAEKRDQVTEFWRKQKVTELARKLAEEIVKKAEAAGPELEKKRDALRRAAQEAGLAVDSLRRFNRTTRAPRAPTAAPNETLSPEAQAVAKRLEFRNRVQQDYSVLKPLEAGRFRDPVLVDEKAGAAFVELVVEKYEPKPIEMQDSELDQERQVLAGSMGPAIKSVADYDALAKRFNLQRYEPRDRKTKPEKSSGKPEKPEKG